jgi:hypothetical protein
VKVLELGLEVRVKGRMEFREEFGSFPSVNRGMVS